VALIRLLGLIFNMESMRRFASVVTVSHSGDGYYAEREIDQTPDAIDLTS
jgi:hypothetical protein